MLQSYQQMITLCSPTVNRLTDPEREFGNTSAAQPKVGNGLNRNDYSVAIVPRISVMTLPVIRPLRRS